MTPQHNIPPLVDSHCHLHSIDLSEFNGDLDEVLNQAAANGVEHLLTVCLEPDDVPLLNQLADRYPNVSISVGIHPNTVLSQELDADALVELSTHPACIAIGETGLDYYRLEGGVSVAVQQSRFRAHIRASILTGKPLIIHTRQAAEDTLLLLKEENAQSVGGVMHCFAEDWDIAKRAMDLNFYISLSGIVTFKNATALQALAKKMPIDRLLIETDSPYLAPVPFRGKQNHPALVKHVAESIAHLRDMDYAEVALQTTENFYRCFNLKRTQS